MRYFRIAVTFIFIVTCVLFGVYYVKVHVTVDKTYPVIEMDSDEITVSISEGDSALLKGVTATDGKDGDITDKIVVVSVSPFIEPGKSTVSYSVCDSDKHVVSASRTVVYSGYKKPKFSLSMPLVFSPEEGISLKGAVGAYDVLDGDISSNVIMTVPDYQNGQTGIFTVHAEAFNSKGDSVTCDLPLVVEKADPSSPTITLSDYLVYVKSGSTVNPYKYIESAENIYGEDLMDTVTYKSHKVSDQDGLYKIDYYVTDVDGSVGHTVLLILPES
ncbi:MAG: DUF5011 domain-containing protein [Clostridiales bacterium]|nr:DUF5011 domain-containing protein [Clostridiales bacterium]